MLVVELDHPERTLPAAAAQLPAEEAPPAAAAAAPAVRDGEVAVDLVKDPQAAAAMSDPETAAMLDVSAATTEDERDVEAGEAGPQMEMTAAEEALQRIQNRPPPTFKGKIRHALWTCDLCGLLRMADMGTISNLITMVVMIIGIILVETVGGLGTKLVRAAGLFGFSGGVTNWLAIKMLFDHVPGLVGSGVVTRQFKVIRQTVMETVLDTFFDAEYLGDYVVDKAGAFAKSNFLSDKIKLILQDPGVEAAVDKELAAMGMRPEGMMLMMMGITTASLKPMIMPMVSDLDKQIGPMVLEKFDPSKMLNTVTLRAQVKELMVSKMEMLTAPMVKALVEEMIRRHLGWLVVWGNLFGAIIGVVCEVAAHPW